MWPGGKKSVSENPVSQDLSRLPRGDSSIRPGLFDVVDDEFIQRHRHGNELDTKLVSQGIKERWSINSRLRTRWARYLRDEIDREVVSPVNTRPVYDQTVETPGQA